MKLFEIRTGHVGCSYERVYVYCKDEAEAVKMFNDKYPENKCEEIRELFDTSSKPFITNKNDEGWKSV
jgi:hypothetical protein